MESVLELIRFRAKAYQSCSLAVGRTNGQLRLNPLKVRADQNSSQRVGTSIARWQAVRLLQVQEPRPGGSDGAGTHFIQEDSAEEIGDAVDPVGCAPVLYRGLSSNSQHIRWQAHIRPSERLSVAK